MGLLKWQPKKSRTQYKASPPDRRAGELSKVLDMPKLSYLTRPRIRVILAELKEAINEHEKGSLTLRNEALKDYKNDITILEQILAI